MSKLGLLFSIESSENQFLVFVEDEKLKNDIIVGPKKLSYLENIKVFFLSKGLKLEEYSIINPSSIQQAQIHLSKETILDYEFNTFWFNAREYRELRQLFFIEEFSEKILISKVVDILNYFR